MSETAMQYVHLAGVAVAVGIVNGRIMIEIDTNEQEAPALHNSQGVPCINVAVNDCTVWRGGL